MSPGDAAISLTRVCLLCCPPSDLAGNVGNRSGSVGNGLSLKYGLSKAASMVIRYYKPIKIEFTILNEYLSWIIAQHICKQLDA